MIERLRILPVLILAATVLFGFKVGDLWQGFNSIGFVSAQAQSKAGQTEKAEAAKREPASDADGKTAAESEGAAAAQPASASKGAADIKRNFTPAELQVLQSLGERRKALDARSAEIATRENVLQAAERRVDEKIAALKELEARIEGLLKQHDEQAEQQLKSLVKVYESMKPKEAARIFQELEMPILIEVTERMREQKMAAILAKMDPAKAKQLTVELATQRQLPETGG